MVASVPLSVVTPQRSLYEGPVEFLVCRGADGELGVLPRHAPLITYLKAGLVMIRNQGVEELLFVAGGFLEIQPDRVTILADVAERAEEIDTQRAAEARRRAEQQLSGKVSKEDVMELEAALERSLARIRVAELRRQRNRA